MKYLITLLVISFQIILSVAIAHGYVRSHTVDLQVFILSYVLPIIIFASINAVIFKMKYHFKISHSIVVAVMLGILGFLISGLFLTMFFGE